MFAQVRDSFLTKVDGAYYCPNWYIVGKNYLTNLPTNTSFRGFGGPQGIFTIESILDAVSQELGMDPVEVHMI